MPDRGICTRRPIYRGRMRLTLTNLPYFEELPEDARAALEAHSQRHDLDAGATVIREGDAATSIYFLTSGSVKVVRGTGGQYLDTINAPTLFGEMAIVADTPRLASVVTAEPCAIYEVGRDEIEKLAHEYVGLRETVLAFHRSRLMANVLRSNSLFAPILPEHKQAIAAGFAPQSAPAGHVFLQEGGPGTGLHVILRGRCEVVRRQGTEEQRLADLCEGDIFGEISLVLFDQMCTATVRATTECVVLRLDREVFQKAVMAHPSVREQIIKLGLSRKRETDDARQEYSKAHLI